jgi:hypothetical protein
MSTNLAHINNQGTILKNAVCEIGIQTDVNPVNENLTQNKVKESIPSSFYELSTGIIMEITKKRILDGDMSGPGYRKLKSPPYEKRLRCVILFFSNNHLCNYTKTIIRLRPGEYR